MVLSQDSCLPVFGRSLSLTSTLFQGAAAAFDAERMFLVMLSSLVLRQCFDSYAKTASLSSDRHVPTNHIDAAASCACPELTAWCCCAGRLTTAYKEVHYVLCCWSCFACAAALVCDYPSRLGVRAAWQRTCINCTGTLLNKRCRVSAHIPCWRKCRKQVVFLLAASTHVCPQSLCILGWLVVGRGVMYCVDTRRRAGAHASGS